jgi:hypothetical protein
MSAFCFPLSEGEPSTVRSIRAGVYPCDGTGVSTAGTTACTMGGGTTAPRSASTPGSAGRSCYSCGSSRAGCDSGCAASCPALAGPPPPPSTFQHPPAPHRGRMFWPQRPRRSPGSSRSTQALTHQRRAPRARHRPGQPQLALTPARRHQSWRPPGRLPHLGSRLP